MKLPPPPINPNEGSDRKNMMIAVVVSLAILFGFHHFVDKPRQEKLRAQAIIVAEQQQKAAASGTSAVAVDENAVKPRAKVLAADKRITITGSKVSGSLSLKGAMIDDLLLLNHYVDLSKKEHVALLSPSGTEHAYFTGSGWVAADSKTAVPDDESVWQLAANSPTSIEGGGKPVVLEWSNGSGLTFRKEISLDDSYLFAVTDSVTNNGASAVKLNRYALVSRRGMPEGYSGMFVLHEGPFGYLGGKEYDPSYKDLIKGEKTEVNAASGFLGITDKYWMVMLLPEPAAVVDARVTGERTHNAPTQFQSDVTYAASEVAAGATVDITSHVYAGVKNLATIKGYETAFGFNNLSLSMDFGMWWFITIPFYWLLHFLADQTGNIAIAILLMTVIVRAAVFNLAAKSFRSMAKMKVVTPMMKELQTKYADDKPKLQAEIFELYKREQVNPFSGCWPVLIQIPIFFALYKVILLSVELRHAPFWGWIHDLSAPDPTTIFNLFGLIPWSPPQMLMIGAWPVLFCLSMIIQKRLSPPMPDEMQEKIQGWFPYIVTIMLAHFASGLVIYWTWSNVLGVLQQYYILKKVGGEETSLIRGHVSRRKKAPTKDKDSGSK